MNAEQWMELASTGTVVTACIPLGYQPTLPVPCISGQKLQIRFCYYRVSMSQDMILVSKPEYYISFSMDGQLLSFVRLDNEDTASVCKELTDDVFSVRQETYMEMLDSFLMQNSGDVQELQEYWISANPGIIQNEIRKLLV